MHGLNYKLYLIIFLKKINMNIHYRKLFYLQVLMLLIGLSNLQAQNVTSDTILYKTVAIKSGKLKDDINHPVKRIYSFKKYDSINVLGYTQNNYLVEVGGVKGYVLAKSYFNENKDLRAYRIGINKIEIDSADIFRERKNEKFKQYEIDKKNTCEYDTNSVDAVTGDIIKSTEYHKVGYVHDYELLIALQRIGKYKFVNFKLNVRLGCSSPYQTSRSKVQVILENDDKLTFYHSGDVRCADDYYLIGKLSPSEFLRLKKSKIKLVRLEGTEGHQDIVDFEFSDFFLNKLECIK